MEKASPITPSSDQAAMAPYWGLVNALMGGAPAIRKAGKKYLPKFAEETDDAYKIRLEHAKLTNIYRDIVENLAQRPFAKEVQVQGEPPESVASLIEDIDGRGNNLHGFAGEVFFEAINNAVDWILIDYTANVPEGATREQERQIGARPYWVRIPAQSVIAVYSDYINGKEEFTHVRIHEPVVERSGYEEVTKNRVRVFDRESLDGGDYGPATYQVLEEQKGKSGEAEWVEIASGPISIGVIPLVPLITGRRLGGWKLHPALQDAAYLQLELYQQESALKHIEELTAFPMLAGNGVMPPLDDKGKPARVPVGPQAVLYAPPGSSDKHGEWSFIEPSSESMKFLLSHIEDTKKELRELGRQPLTAQSGNLTVVTTAFAAQKGNAAVQAWALGLKDALEQAFVITGMWLQESAAIEVEVNTDFDLGIRDDDKFADVLEMHARDVIEDEDLVIEAKRRGTLRAEHQFDATSGDTLP